MARYIDADAVHEEIEAIQTSLESSDDRVRRKNKPYYKGLAMARAIINEQPTADVAPRSKVERLTINMNAFGLAAKRLQEEKDNLIKTYSECMKDYAREIFEEIGEYASDFAAGHIDDDNFLQAIYNLRAKYTDPVHCKDCQHLMFSDCYGECSKGHRGIVKPDDTCEHGVKKCAEDIPHKKA